MAQNRTHDYRGERSSANLNRKFVDIIPPGVYSGFTVAVDGTIAPGVLMTAEGIRIEEDAPVSVSPPVGDATYSRKDLIVCQYMYETSVPAPQATYAVIEGIPAETPEYPAQPEHTILLAQATMAPGGVTWSENKLVNSVPVPKSTDLAGNGWNSALTLVQLATDLVNEVDDRVNAVATEADTREQADAALVNTINQSVGAEADAREQADALLANKGGDTFTGHMTFQDDVTFPAAHAADVKFDGDVEFKRTIPASAGSCYLGGSPDPYYAAGKINFNGISQAAAIPIPTIVGAEIVSVKFGFINTDGNAHTIDMSLLRKTLTSNGAVNVTQEIGIPANDVLSSTLLVKTTDGGGTAGPRTMAEDELWEAYVQAKDADFDTSVFGWMGITVTYRRRKVIQ